MLFKAKSEFQKILIYEYDHALQTMHLIYEGEHIPKDYKRGKKLWTGIDKRRKIKTIIVAS